MLIIFISSYLIIFYVYNIFKISCGIWSCIKVYSTLHRCGEGSLEALIQSSVRSHTSPSTLLSVILLLLYQSQYTPISYTVAVIQVPVHSYQLYCCCYTSPSTLLSVILLLLYKFQYTPISYTVAVIQIPVHSYQLYSCCYTSPSTLI